MVGALLGALAAAVPIGGRVCELGTGAGVGLAWIVNGLGPRDDVRVFTVDTDQCLQDAVAVAGWPDWVEFVRADGARAVAQLCPLDLVFADAPAGKVERLDATVAALAPRGVLVVDDMDPARHEDGTWREQLVGVRDQLVRDPALAVAELTVATGVIVATKRA